MKHIVFGQPKYIVDEIIDNIDAGVAHLGGFSKIFGESKSILLKPNLVLRSSRIQAAMTDPAIVEAAIIYFTDKGIKVSLGDSPAFESARVVSKQNGIADVCRKLNVPIIEFDKNIRQENTWGITSTLNDFDCVVNLPKLKGHKQLYYTGAVKNLFGCVAGKKKFIHHMMIGDANWLFAKMLIEISFQISPRLTIMDGIYAMAGNGPLNGESVPLGLLGISTEPLGLDISICKYLRANFAKLDIFQAKELYFNDLEVDEELTFFNEELINKDLFYFPFEKSPIRFSFTHAIRSVYKSLSKRFVS